MIMNENALMGSVKLHLYLRRGDRRCAASATTSRHCDQIDSCQLLMVLREMDQAYSMSFRAYSSSHDSHAGTNVTSEDALEQLIDALKHVSGLVAPITLSSLPCYTAGN